MDEPSDKKRQPPLILDCWKYWFARSRRARWSIIARQANSSAAGGPRLSGARGIPIMLPEEARKLEE